jgi:hypothetical protein
MNNQQILLYITAMITMQDCRYYEEIIFEYIEILPRFLWEEYLTGKIPSLGIPGTFH